MKNAIAQITQHSAAISAGLARIADIDADIQRATQATQEADKIRLELEALSRQRAELRARAFVGKTVADTAELDKQEKALERAGRQAVEDGQAAAMAITMLETSRAELRAEVDSVEGQRKDLVIAWLKDRQDKAVKQYIAVLDNLANPLGEAYAVDRLLATLDARDEQIGNWLIKQLCAGAIPVPHAYKVERPGRQGSVPIYDAPFTWLRDDALGSPEVAKLMAELREAGMHIARA